MVEATLAEVERRPDAEVVAVFTSVPGLLRPRSRVRSIRRVIGALLRRRPLGRSGRIGEVCRKFDIPLLLVDHGDPNRPEFLADLAERFGPDVALSYWSMTIFGSEWLDTFDTAVNFHDGHIPDHRGVGATTVEVYEGLAEGGYTFHHIDRGIDTGNVLVAGSVPITGVEMMDIIEAKLVTAGSRVGEVLDKIDSGDPGRQQQGAGSYTSARM